MATHWVYEVICGYFSPLHMVARVQHEEIGDSLSAGSSSLTGGLGCGVDHAVENKSAHVGTKVHPKIVVSERNEV